MTEPKRDFDKEAALWDNNPVRVKLADDVASGIIGEVKPSPGMDVLDFGCGTGLLTLRLQPLVRSIAGADSSRGMLDILEAKVAARHLDNVKTMLLDIESGGIPEGSYHLIVSSMTLHHIRGIEPLLRCLHASLLPGGHISIADLDLDGGEFHDNDEGVFHAGFDRDELRATFVESGFEDIRHRTVAELLKPARSGGVRKFPVFLMSARKAH